LLGSATGGFVEAVRVERGESVREGQVLFEIDYDVKRAQQATAEANLSHAQGELRRAEALGDLATPARLAGLQTQLALAEASAVMARIATSRALVRAPFGGVVGQTRVHVGEIAVPGAPVARVVKLDPIEVVLSVSDRDVVALREGLEAIVSTAATGTLKKGVVSHLGPVADLQTRTFLVEVEVPNPDRSLLPGMITRVQVARPVARDSVVIPQDWLVTRIDGYGVFVQEQDVARWRAVELGDLVRGQVVIRSGLSVGDRLVVVGQQELVDGDPILVAREGTCCANGRAVF
jgi:membrane fusion protein (multidrug efflux system)